MRILLTGATGLIGAAVLGRLVDAGHAVVAVSRRRGPAAARLRAERVLPIDIRNAVRAEDWLPHLAGIDAVVNCAGVLQDGPGDSTAAVHTAGIPALFEACERAGVRRVLHVSALGVDGESSTGFARTKGIGDAALMARDLDWIVLRPSLVLGRTVYGGSALIRGLAALPVLALPADAGRFQPVRLDEVAATALAFLASDAPTRRVVELVGPERLTIAEVVALHRRWLGWAPARIVRLPGWAANAMFAAGDLIGRLGWRPPVRSTTRAEMARDAVGDPGEWTRLTGIRPRTLAAALAAAPAGVQDRWFAALYFAKPAALGVLALFWIATGLVALGPGWRAGIGTLELAGFGALAPAAAAAGALADIAIGAGIAVRRTAHTALVGGIALALFYLLAATVLTPALWIDPLGPLLKVLPLLALHAVALAILGDR